MPNILQAKALRLKLNINVIVFKILLSCPEIGLHKSKHMREKTIENKQHYSEAFKRMVIQEYLNTGVSKMSLLKKYNIKMKSGIQRWMRQMDYENIHQKTGYLPDTNTTASLTSKKVKEDSSATEDELKARIRELERLLEDEQLRSEAYNRIIDIAEKEHHIPIRKKPNTR